MANKRSPGEAMKACTPRERAFVYALVETGSDHTRAALIAGYSPEKDSRGEHNSATVAGYRLTQRPRVQAAIREEAERSINSAALVGASVLIEIMRDPFHKDRFKAAVETLNRSGLQVTTRHEVNVNDNRTVAQLEQFVRVTAEKYGIDPKTLLGTHEALPAPVIDAEFEDVADDDLSDILG